MRCWSSDDQSLGEMKQQRDLPQATSIPSVSSSSGGKRLMMLDARCRCREM